LSTKKELEGVADKPEKEASSGEKGQLGVKDINTLRELIQQLCQSTNPLGRALDYMQEDVDAMNKEYETWKRECKNYEMQAQEKLWYSLK
jgi:TRAF3-interacting protein 1